MQSRVRRPIYRGDLAIARYLERELPASGQCSAASFHDDPRDNPRPTRMFTRASGNFSVSADMRGRAKFFSNQTLPGLWKEGEITRRDYGRIRVEKYLKSPQMLLTVTMTRYQSTLLGKIAASTFRKIMKLALVAIGRNNDVSRKVRYFST